MRRRGLTVAVSILASAALVVVLVGKWDELEAGITGAAAGIIVLAVALQVVALVSRSEAWRVCVHASGGTVSRRKLYRASSFGCVGQLLNSQLGTAARIAALRRSAPGRDAARARSDRGRVAHPLRRGGAGRAHIVHARRPAGTALVDSGPLRGGRGLRGTRVQEHRGRARALAAQGPVGTALAEGQHAAGGLRADRGVRADRSQLADAECRGRGCFCLRRDRRADRGGLARPASRSA